MNKRTRGAGLVLVALTVAALAVPGSASGATVAVVVDGTVHSIEFHPADGEVNTVTLGVVQTGDPTTYSVTDTTAPLVAGAECSGGGAAGSTVTCPLPAPATPCYVRGCPPIVAVSDVIEVDLGDGDDSLNSTAVPPPAVGFGPFTVRAIGGSGADGFVDGAGSATFDPGTGADHVITGAGFDYVDASTGSPDGADVFDFGSKPDGTLRYTAATYPVSVSLDDIANDGGEGEGDQVIGSPAVVGGSADDILIGNDEPLRVQDLSGSGGDDLIIGGAVHDSLTGDSGDDTIRGKGGRDSLYGDSVVASAGGNNGDDTLVGGSGNDFIQGFRGSDLLRGGSGADSLAGDSSISNDGDRDVVDCGPSQDHLAYVGAEDRVRRCERVRTRPR
jgi:Ca2+-binding RTX toxin-like protein